MALDLRLGGWRGVLGALAVGAGCAALASGLRGPGEARPGEWGWLQRERARSGELDERRAAVQERYAGKHRIAADLLAGRLTFAEALARSRALHAADRFGPPAGLPRSYVIDDEKLGRQLVLYAEDTLADRPDRAEALARLERELRHYLERRGPPAGAANPSGGTEPGGR
jgi:hypothetical protein